MTDLRHVPAWIIVPATAPQRFATAHTCGAGVVMVDLEDSVAATDKASARDLAASFFTDLPAGVTSGVRVNAPGTVDGVRDLLEMREWPVLPDLVLVPKVESPRDLDLVAGVLDGAPQSRLLALVETPAGIEHASDIARAERLAGLVFGAADYAAALGCQLTWEALIHARAAVVNAAATVGVAAVDSPYFAMQDPDGLAAEATRARELGYTGKGAVHPRQVPVIELAFRPDAAELAAAHAVLDAAMASGGAITSVDGAMVGRPFFVAAAAVAARAGNGAR